jgi:hypothetical protein
MRYIGAVLVCFALIAVSAHAYAASLKIGDYLGDDFAKLLASTRSPYRAITSAMAFGPQSIHVAPESEFGQSLSRHPHGSQQTMLVLHDDDPLRFMANANWHEGYVLFRLHQDGRQDRGEQDTDYPRPRIDSPTHFWFREPGPNTPWRGYSYVGDADRAVARIALAGRYADAHVHIVQFGTDGILRGLGPDIPFFLNNDHVVGNHFDWFYMGKETDESNARAFRRRGSHLILYKIIAEDTGNPNDIGRPDFDHPLMELEQIKRP